jgi:hypothetical protein
VPLKTPSAWSNVVPESKILPAPKRSLDEADRGLTAAPQNALVANKILFCNGNNDEHRPFSATVKEDLQYSQDPVLKDPYKWRSQDLLRIEPRLQRIRSVINRDMSPPSRLSRNPATRKWTRPI